jgi:hypothetical protein
MRGREAEQQRVELQERLDEIAARLAALEPKGRRTRAVARLRDGEPAPSAWAPPRVLRRRKRRVVFERVRLQRGKSRHCSPEHPGRLVGRARRRAEESRAVTVGAM